MNKFYAIVVVILIFGLPAGSYLYLQKGYDFRKAALDQLDNPIELSQIIAADKLEALKDTLRDKVTIVASQRMSTMDVQELTQKLNDQFGMNDQFQILEADGETDIELLLQEKALAIYDVDHQLRQTYDYTSEDLKSMVTHISILLPMPVEKDIVLKRDLETNER